MLTDEVEGRNDGKEKLNVNKMVKFSEFNSSQVNFYVFDLYIYIYIYIYICSFVYVDISS